MNKDALLAAIYRLEREAYQHGMRDGTRVKGVMYRNVGAPHHKARRDLLRLLGVSEEDEPTPPADAGATGEGVEG